jgi:membrane-associated phospholipid phosphatase
MLFLTDAYSFLAPEYKLFILFSIFMLTAAIPVISIIILKKAGFVSSILLHERKERTLPYLFTLLSYTAAVMFLMRLPMPSYIVMMMVASIAATLAIALINLRWKISAHLCGMGSLCAAILVVSLRFGTNYVWALAIAFLLSGCVAASRIELKAHTPMQTLAGFWLGFLFILVGGMMDLFLLNLFSKG